MAATDIGLRATGQRSWPQLPALLVLLTLSAAGAPAAPRTIWFAEPLPPDARVTDGTTASLSLLTEAGKVAATSPAVVVAQDREAYIVAPLPVPGTGNYQLSARIGQGPRRLDLAIPGQRAFDFDTVDVLLLVDTSSSMRENDPRDLRLAAMRDFVALARHSDRIARLAVIAFESDAKVLLPLTAPAAVPDLGPLVKSLKPHGSTDFAAAFRAAQRLLARGATGKTAVLFLSDGQPMRRYRDEHRDLGALQTPVYTIGLSGEADAALLSRISDETGARFFDAPEAEQLRSIFLRIFQLIDPPQTVVSTRQTVPPANAIELLLDPSMRNPVLALAPLGGKVRATLDATPVLDDRSRDLLFYPVPPEGPARRVLQLDGDGKLSVALTANTEVALQHLALSRDAPANTMLRAAFFVSGLLSPEAWDAACRLRRPDGASVELHPEPTGQPGLLRLSYRDTAAPGTYLLTIRVQGHHDGAPFRRQTEVSFRRRPVANAVAGELQRVRSTLPEPTVERPGEALPIATPGATPALAPGALRTTFWGSSTEYLLQPLVPGRRAAKTVELLVSAPTGTKPVCELLPSGCPGIDLQLQGELRLGRKCPIEISATPTAEAVGKHFSTQLVVRLGTNQWQIPVQGDVMTPGITLQADKLEVQETDSLVRAVGALRVRLAPDGQLPVHLSADIAGLKLTPSDLVADSSPRRVELRFELHRPITQTTWSGRILAESPGLPSTEVPFAVEFTRRPASIAVGGAPAPEPAASTHWLWLLLLILLAILLIGLAGAALRGNRRAAFVLLSLLVHVGLLMMVVPRRTHEDEDKTVTVMRITSGTSLQETQVSSEIAAFRDPNARPESATTAKAELPEPEVPEADSREVESPTVHEPTPLDAEATEPEPLPKENIDVAELPPDVRPIPRKETALEVPEETHQPAPATRETMATEATASPVQQVAIDQVRDVTEPVAQAKTITAEIARSELRPKPLEAETSAVPRQIADEVTGTDAAQASQLTPAESVETDSAAAAAASTVPVGTARGAMDDAPQSRTVAARPPLPAPRPTALPVTPAKLPQKKQVAGSPATGAATVMTASIGPAPAPLTAPPDEARPALPAAASTLPAAAPAVALSLPPVDRPPLATAVADITPHQATGPQRVNVESGRSVGQPRASRLPGATIAVAEPAASPVAAGAVAPDALAIIAERPDGPRLRPVERTGLRAGSVASPRYERPQQPATPGPTAPLAAGPASGNIRRSPLAVETPTPAARPELTTSAPMPGLPASAPPPRSTPDMAPAQSTPADLSAVPVLTAKPHIAAPPGAGPEQAVKGETALPANNSPTPIAVATATPHRSVPVAVPDAVVGPVEASVDLPARGPRASAAPTTAAPAEFGTPAKLSRRAVHLTVPESQALDSSSVAALTAWSGPPLADRQTAAPRLPVVRPKPEFPSNSGGERQPPAIRIGGDASTGQAGPWQNTLPLLRYGGDWDCDRTAMLNLAHQLELRTGSILPFDSRTVTLTDPAVGQAPFLFMTGHLDFHFTDAEIAALRRYIQAGGYVWINDSTDLGNETFDRAVRREMARVLPTAQWQRVPPDHALFQAPYDLTGGYRGYAIPPGDKYRQDYLEGLWIGRRLSILYTRNDYADGMEIDPHTHPLMASLTDLSPREMQEASVRMGINIVTHFMDHGTAPDQRMVSRLRTRAQREAAREHEAPKGRELPLQLLDADQWVPPAGWDNLLPTTASPAAPGIEIRFSGDAAMTGRRYKAALSCDLPWTLQRNALLVLEVESFLHSGARLAVAMSGVDGKTYFESAPVYVRPGLNRNLVIDLRKANFKTAVTNWEYTGQLPDSWTVTTWHLLVYPQHPAGRLHLRQLRLLEP